MRRDAMTERKLTPISYIVLGLLQEMPGTPYDLKARVAASLGNFWTVQHAQLYTETARLAEEGLLKEERETEGRRRKTYSITKAGAKALASWLEVPAADIWEIRDPGLLKIFFGADPAMIAAGQVAAHQAKVTEWENFRENIRGLDVPEGPRLTLEAGIIQARAATKFWSSLL
jgi:PadR family transcriptional regulator, regulatory protein AphA